jgi:hypothetical protein
MARHINPLWLSSILQEVLDLKISIADHPRVSKVLAESWRRSRVELTEDLLVALRSPKLEIRMPEAYLREITTTNTEKDVFTLLRDGLFYELGVHFPDFRLQVDESLRPHLRSEDQSSNGPALGGHQAEAVAGQHRNRARR